MVVLAAYYPMTGVTEQLAQWQKFAPYYVGDGVVATTLNKFSVAQHAPAGMSVDVASGRGFIQGVFGENGSSTQLTIAAADATNPRIDRVVMRVDTSANDFELVVLTGTPAVSPTAAPLIRSATQTDYSLCQVLVGTTVSSIVTANVTDERGFASPRGIPLSPRAMVVAATLECFTPSALTEGWLWAQVSGTGTISNIAIANPPAAAGQVLLLQLTTAGATVVSGGNVNVLTPFYSMLGSDAFLTLVWDGSTWQEIGRSAQPATTLPNALPNGDFSVWQRGTSFAAVANGAYIADCMLWTTVGANVVTISRDTDVPTVAANAVNTPYSLKIAVTTADASIAAGDLAALILPIEGFDYRPLTNGFAVSFWVKATKTGIYSFYAKNRGNDRAYVTEFTVNVTNTWEYKTLTVPTPPTGGTWDYSTGMGLQVGIALMAGSTYTGTAGSWLSAGPYASTNQVNGVDSTSNTFRVALMNVIPGSNPAPLLPVPYATQLARCQRYFQILADSTNAIVGTGQCTTATLATVTRALPVEMGSTPTLVVTSATDFRVTKADGSTQSLTALATATAGRNSISLTATVASGLVAGNATVLFWNGGTGLLTAEWDPA